MIAPRLCASVFSLPRTGLHRPPTVEPWAHECCPTNRGKYDCSQTCSPLGRSCGPTFMSPWTVPWVFVGMGFATFAFMVATGVPGRTVIEITWTQSNDFS
jgi:hypothetical protein